jgi:hypothetical protein
MGMLVVLLGQCGWVLARAGAAAVCCEQRGCVGGAACGQRLFPEQRGCSWRLRTKWRSKGELATARCDMLIVYFFRCCFCRCRRV